jgi:hypothetical protein
LVYFFFLKDKQALKAADTDYDEDDEDLNNITYCSLCALISISALTGIYDV